MKSIHYTDTATIALNSLDYLNKRIVMDSVEHLLQFDDRRNLKPTRVTWSLDGVLNRPVFALGATPSLEVLLVILDEFGGSLLVIDAAHRARVEPILTHPTHTQTND